jgi:fructose-bisphosphate aldolase class II
VCETAGPYASPRQSLDDDKKTLPISTAGAVAIALHVRAVAAFYGVPVVLHSDHCAKKLLPWFDGMLAADEA